MGLGDITRNEQTTMLPHNNALMNAFLFQASLRAGSRRAPMRRDPITLETKS